MANHKAKPRSAYAAAGVDIDEKMAALKAIKPWIKSTATRGALSDIGAFGGMFASPGRNAILVSSTDGVGTKLKVAMLAERHHTVGQDIVNHCVNDILVQGAEPLFFLDYFGCSQFESWVFKAVVAGLCKACRENGCTLIGGETAEMPGLYPKGEYDLVGTLVGAVNRSRIVTGRTIRPGDRIIGLASTGLHTNGFSLARKIIFEKARLNVNDPLPGVGKTVADALLAVHKSYLKPIQRLMAHLTVRGLAHITGGGFQDNVPRILPRTVDAVIDRAAWPVPPLFQFLQRSGRVDREEMYRVFNMGIGMAVVVRSRDVKRALALLARAKADPVEIGWIEKGRGSARLIN